MLFSPFTRSQSSALDRRRLIATLAASAFAVGGCSHLKSDAPKCSGRRRPANPNGSVLTNEAPAPQSASTGLCGRVRP